jgi:undecaprenyl-diphosphatase
LALLQILVLAAVQGITEFLPISSQAHLILVDDFASWPDAGLEIRIAVHVGSLGAVILYFRRDMWAVIKGLFQMLIGRSSDGARLAIHLFIAAVPVIGAGAVLVLLDLADALQSPTVIAWTMLVFGILLWFADRVGMTVRRIEHMTGGAALIIGLAQVLALIPGTSRAGITMTAARMMGYERTEASRFSMLLALPVILAAGGWDAYSIYREGNWQLGVDAILAAAVAFAVAFGAIVFLMKWLETATFTPFVIYRVVVGGALLYWIYFGSGAIA